MNCADKALPVTRRAVRAACLVVSMTALSISASAQHSIGLGGAVNPALLANHPALEVPLGSRSPYTPRIPQAPAPGTFRKFAVPAFIALQSLDAGATEYGFHQRNWIEHNAMIPHSTAGRMTYFGLTGAGVVLGSRWLEHRGHGRLSKALLVGAIVVEGYAASHSLAGLR